RVKDLPPLRPDWVWPIGAKSVNSLKKRVGLQDRSGRRPNVGDKDKEEHIAPDSFTHIGKTKRQWWEILVF
ncbi:MAG: hypothetical protein QF637_11295, partial [Acidimicrobiales bacterium]|nr:hypothetical protein [Acidimicrobiales bacterium]